MLNHVTKLILCITFLIHPFCSFSYDVSTRDIVIGASTLTAGIVAGIIGTSYYHPASLEKIKLEQEKEEKRKKALAEQVEKDRQHAAEVQKLQALNVLWEINHTYGAEFERIRKEKLHEKNELLTIIKENCGMKDMPLNHYHAMLYNHLNSLRSLESHLPADKQQERLTLISNLERILKVYNTHIADKAKTEKDEIENKRKKDEFEQRKIEKEELEIKKLRLEVENIKDTQKELHQISCKLDTLTNKFSNASTKGAEHAHEIIGLINALRVKQAQDSADLSKVISKGFETTESRFALLFKLFDQARTFVNQMVGQPQYQAAPAQPPYNPEIYQQPMPTPSAPPL